MQKSPWRFCYLVMMPRRPEDIYFVACCAEVKQHFETYNESVFYSRQLEVMFEDDYFHWLTNRAIHELLQGGYIKDEEQQLSWGGSVHLYWHKSYRYYKKKAKELIRDVETYSNPEITIGVGDNGENLIIEGFARCGFEMLGRDVNEFDGKVWMETGHDLDFVFRKDGILYGVEVKNTLGYIKDDEFKAKIRMAQYFGARPVFACRMLPKSWIYKLHREGGFGFNDEVSNVS